MGSEKVKIVLRDLLLLFILVAGHTNAKEFSLCEYGPPVELFDAAGNRKG
jgi:hypothetical protein